MLRVSALLFCVSLATWAQETPKPEPAPAAAAVAQAAPLPAATAPLLDEGLLEPAWFGSAIAFTKGEDVDFFWIKPGLDLTGHTLHMKPWDDPVMLRKGRDGKDNAKATELTDAFPAMLRGALAGAFNGKAKVSRTEGDLALTGRFVDANAGNKVAKWLIGLGAGSETATWDLKILEPKTGEVLVAVHHRAISLTAMSNIQDKMGKWADKFSTFVATQAVK